MIENQRIHAKKTQPDTVRYSNIGKIHQLNGGFDGIFIYEWWIFGHAMFHDRRVSEYASRDDAKEDGWWWIQ